VHQQLTEILNLTENATRDVEALAQQDGPRQLRDALMLSDTA
jgi:hypothetical protein